jgi:hypothetical protein
MNIDAMFPSNYVKASDLAGKPRTLRISGTETEKMGDGEMKPVLYFGNATKGLVLNKTNANVLKDIYGSDTDSWINKPIQLFATHTEFQGKRVECIRLRATPQEEKRVVREAAAAAVAMAAPPAHVTAPSGEPEQFADLDDEIPF